MMHHYVYRVTNTTDRKHYYGVRSCNCHPEQDLGIRYLSSSRVLKRDVKRLGTDAFKWKILKTFSTRELAEQFEIKCHRRLNVTHRNDFYNLTIAKVGCAVWHGQRHSDKMKKYLRDVLTTKMQQMSADQRSVKFGNFGPDNPFFGKKHSPEVADKIKANKPTQSGELNPFYGKNHSASTRQRLSEHAHTRYENGGVHPMTGRKHRTVSCDTCNKTLKFPMWKRWHSNGQCKDRISRSRQQ